MTVQHDAKGGVVLQSVPRGCRALVAFEELYFPLVLFRFLPRFERPEIAATARLWISLSRVEPVTTGFQFSNHDFVVARDVPRISAETRSNCRWTSLPERT